MMRRVGWIACAASILFCCSCVLIDHPPDPPEAAVWDEDLLGHWRLISSPGISDDAEESNVQIYCIGLAGEEEPANMLHILSAQLDEEQRTRPLWIAAYATQVGELQLLTSLMNSTATDDGRVSEHRPVGWPVGGALGSQAFLSISRYEIEENELRIYSVDEELLSAALESGDLEGSIGRNGVPFASITSSAEELKQYIAAGKPLFAEEPTLVLQRVE